VWGGQQSPGHGTPGRAGCGQPAAGIQGVGTICPLGSLHPGLLWALTLPQPCGLLMALYRHYENVRGQAWRTQWEEGVCRVPAGLPQPRDLG